MGDIKIPHVVQRAHEVFTMVSAPTTLSIKRSPVVSSPVLGMLIFILTEIMVFASFISAFNIIKSGFNNWPPLGQPRLPVEITAFNSLFLIASGWLIYLAYKCFGKGEPNSKVKKYFLWALFSGLLFVLLQGMEWGRLIGYGLTMTSSVYGSFFYLIIGTHALHVLGAIIGLVLVYRRLVCGSLKTETFAAMQAFWFFVVALWPVLYVLVYL
ncbi:MAG: hypothetical protein A2048_05855 [Deltaproteobacteria bacterium GWA2_45_12]|nr:MAG: hypothetical protein A2048_05855 [Deltaproteobacteria bacterium GWA2_45_12]